MQISICDPTRRLNPFKTRRDYFSSGWTNRNWTPTHWGLSTYKTAISTASDFPKTYQDLWSNDSRKNKTTHPNQMSTELIVPAWVPEKWIEFGWCDSNHFVKSSTMCCTMRWKICSSPNGGSWICCGFDSTIIRFARPISTSSSSACRRANT